MQISYFSSVKTTTYFTVTLAAHEVDDLVSEHGNLSAAGRAGAYAPALPNATDPVTSEINPDGTATVIILVTRTTIDDTSTQIGS